MSRRLLLAALALVAAALPWIAPPQRIAAQVQIQALTPYALIAYSRPDRAAPIIGVFTPHAKVALEGRSADAVWVLGHSTDGSVRGWIERRYLLLPPDASVARLLVSNEIIFVPPAAPRTDSAHSVVDLTGYPVVPVGMGRARAIYESGRILGANARAVAKVGDCISDNQHFLSPFGGSHYNLGEFAYLQGVVDHFGASLALDSLAAYDGLVTSAVLDPVFANPLACQPGESPLRCEYRVHRPSVAVIMFGAQDLLFTPAEQFERNLRQIVHETIQAGVIPLLSTFPGNLERWEQSIEYNQIVVRVALDYNVPLMNLWLALEALPNHGLNEDGRHLSPPFTDSGDLAPANLQRGYPLRNLVTLQALDAVWRAAMQ
ncbi:MAG: GDSL-type esterase/lipase family protein [Chloroflexota bacterium]|jgi:hypothetical protein